jgi:transcriptional regulator with XRE-family HTH domain
MPEEWTGRLIGDMHNAGVSRAEVARELGVSTAYVTMVLNGIRTPEGAEKKLRAAFERVKEAR